MAPGSMHEVSIYRSLQALVRARVVHRVETGQRVWRFALCDCGRLGHCHAHFVCRGCGRAQCLDQSAVPQIPMPEEGYVVEGQEHYLRGLCPRCQDASV